MSFENPEQKKLDENLKIIDIKYGGYAKFYETCKKAGISVPTYTEMFNVRTPLYMAGIGMSSGFSVFDPIPVLVPSAPRYLEEAAERARQQRLRQFNSNISAAFRSLERIERQQSLQEIGGLEPMYRMSMNVAMEYINYNFGSYAKFRDAAQKRGYDVSTYQPQEVSDTIIAAIDDFIARPPAPIETGTQATPIDPNFRFHGFEEWSQQRRLNEDRVVLPDSSANRDIEMTPPRMFQPEMPIEQEYPQEEKYGGPDYSSGIRDILNDLPANNSNTPTPMNNAPGFEAYIRPYRNNSRNQDIGVKYQTVIANMISSMLNPQTNQTLNSNKVSGIRVPMKLKPGQRWSIIEGVLKQLKRDIAYDRPLVTEGIMRVLHNNGVPRIERNESMVKYTNRVFGNMPTPQIERIVNEIMDSLRETIPVVGNAYEPLNLSVEAPRAMPTFDVMNPRIQIPAIQGLVRLGLSEIDANTIYNRLAESVELDRINSYDGEITYQQLQDNSRDSLYRQLNEVLEQVEQLTGRMIDIAQLKVIFDQVLEGFNLKYTVANLPTLTAALGGSNVITQIMDELEAGDMRNIEADPRQVREVLEGYGFQTYRIVNTRYFKIFRAPRPDIIDQPADGAPPPPPPPLYTITIGEGNARRTFRNINPKTLGIILGMLFAAGAAIKTIIEIIKAIREEHSQDSANNEGSISKTFTANNSGAIDSNLPYSSLNSYNKNSDDSNIIQEKPTMKSYMAQQMPPPMAPITGQVLPNSGGTIMPYKAITMGYTDAAPIRAMNSNSVPSGMPPQFRLPVNPKDILMYDENGNKIIQTPDTSTDITSNIPTNSITLDPANSKPKPQSVPYDYKKLGDLQLYIYQTNQKIASGKFSKAETDYMSSEIIKANDQIKSMVGSLNKSESYRDTSYNADTMYDQDKSARQKSYYDQSIALENNFQESRKQYEAELSRLKLMYKDPMLSRAEVNAQKIRVDELKSTLSKTKNEYDDILKVIAYGNQNRSNLNIPGDYTPTNVSQATIYNQIQQMEAALKTSNPEAFTEYSNKVRNMELSRPDSKYNNYFENRLASIQDIYKTNNMPTPEIQTIDIRPLSELISDDADTIVQFNKDIDVRLDEGSGTRRAAVKDPAEVKLFLSDDATARKQQVMFESFSRIAPGHGLGTMNFNTLRQHNSRTDRLQFAHTLDTAPKYNPNLNTPTMMYPTELDISKQDPNVKLQEFYRYQDSVRNGPTQAPFIPVYQSDFGRVEWEQDGIYGDKLMGVNRNKSSFTPERITSNIWSDYDNPSSIYHPELALRNSLYRSDVFRPVQILETKQQGFYMGQPSTMRPSQQSNILIANDKTGINYTPLMRNDMFGMDMTQKSNIDTFKQPIRGLINRQKKMFKFSE